MISDDDEAMRQFFAEASALMGQPDADDDGEPDGLVAPAATPARDPLMFERAERVRTAQDIVRGRGAGAARTAAKVASPITIGRFCSATARGFARFVSWLYDYYNAADRMDLRLKNPRAHFEIHEHRRKRTFIALGAVVMLVCFLYYHFGRASIVAEVLALIASFAVAGRKGPIIHTAAGEGLGYSETRIQRAIAEAVLGIDLGSDKTRDLWKRVVVREGWCRVSDSDTMTIRLGLPAPHSGRRALARTREIAAALDLAAHQIRIVPDAVGMNEGDFDLIVYGTNPWAIPPTRAACASTPVRTDVWDGIDFGIDIDRRPVRLELIGKSMLIGGLPEMGKTTTASTLMLSLALDPYVRLWVADAKGVDTTPLIPLAYRYVGPSQDEMLAMLAELEAWGRKKLAALKDCGKVKMSREICAMYRQIDPNHPLAVIDVVYIDEARYYTNGAVEIQNKRIVSRLSQVIEMLRAAGVVVVIATQRPSAKNIPSEIRDLVRVRCAHACSSPTMSNFILGEGAAGLGYTASQFSEDEPGVAWIRVLKSFNQVRPHLTELADLERAAVVAYDLRKAAGTLPEAIDASGAADTPQILIDIDDILREREWDKVPTYELLPLLAARSPIYDGMSAVDLAGALNQWGVSPGSIGEWGESRNVRGYRKKNIENAISKTER